MEKELYECLKEINAAFASISCPYDECVKSLEKGKRLITKYEEAQSRPVFEEFGPEHTRHNEENR